MNSKLQATFQHLSLTYSDDTSLAHQCWNEIEQHYTSSSRHYHTLVHLHHLLLQLSSIKEQIKDWNTILFTLFYHDVVYDVLKSDNEEQSAIFAVKHLSLLKVPPTIIDNCYNQIIATKHHLLSIDNDTNLFTDADLSILGQPWNLYKVYAENVRKEYDVYPNDIYTPGRKKVLEHFLEMEKIYKTIHFDHLFEKQARINIAREATGVF